jgi:hypothetical protein
MSNINTATRRRQWMIAGISAAVMLATGGVSGPGHIIRQNLTVLHPKRPRT